MSLTKDPDGDGLGETVRTKPLKLAGGPSVLASLSTSPWDCFADNNGRKTAVGMKDSRSTFRAWLPSMAS